MLVARSGDVPHFCWRGHLPHPLAMHSLCLPRLDVKFLFGAPQSGLGDAVGFRLLSDLLLLDGAFRQALLQEFGGFTSGMARFVAASFGLHRVGGCYLNVLCSPLDVR